LPIKSLSKARFDIIFSQKGIVRGALNVNYRAKVKTNSMT
jgi:hypothetical protein